MPYLEVIVAIVWLLPGTTFAFGIQTNYLKIIDELTSNTHSKNCFVIKIWQKNRLEQIGMSLVLLQYDHPN